VQRVRFDPTKPFPLSRRSGSGALVPLRVCLLRFLVELARAQHCRCGEESRRLTP